jgi:hypothetical protein
MSKSINHEAVLYGKGRQGLCGLPVMIRKAFGKQLRFLLANLGHPSLHAKKYSESLDVWQGKVTRDWRFYFRIGAMNMSFFPSFPTRNKGRRPTQTSCSQA